MIARRGRRPATTRAEIAAAAFGLFEERGFDDTTVDDIAAAVGIARRTFFSYYASKFELVWGDFDTELQAMRMTADALPAGTSLMAGVRRIVMAFHQVGEAGQAQHRARLALILGTPSLLADSTLRFEQWRAVIAGYAASRLECADDDLLPVVIGYASLGAAMGAYEQWLSDDSADPADLLNAAFTALSRGFRGMPS